MWVCLQREVLQEGGVVRAEDATLVEFGLKSEVGQLVAQLDDADGMTRRIGDGHREHTACQGGCVGVRLRSHKSVVIVFITYLVVIGNGGISLLVVEHGTYYLLLTARYLRTTSCLLLTTYLLVVEHAAVDVLFVDI